MKWFLVSFLIFLPAFSISKSERSEDKFHVCFFELDNTVTSKNFKNRIKNPNERTDLCKKKQEFSSANTVVHCYQPTNENETGAGAFKRMIQDVSSSGDKCDALVMSGHHTGDWYGKVGSIKLKDMEELSCDPKYRDWFSNIKALWLDGCNTVTDNLLKSSTGVPTPDSETARVIGKEYVEESKEINRGAIFGTSQAYTASLDKNTPLSSRYLRMFPHTQIYGYNGAAPEGKDKGEQTSFIVDHLAHIGSALRAEEFTSEKKKQVLQIKTALSAISSFDPCDEDKMEAWEKASWKGIRTEAIEQQDYKTVFRLGCNLTLAKQVLDNPSSKESQKALANYIKSLEGKDGVQNKAELLQLANEILEKPNSEKAVSLAKKLLLNTLDEITLQDEKVREEDKTYTHLLFNNIYDTWKIAQKYKTKDSNFYKSTQKKLQADNFSNSLKERLDSDNTASLRKGDYIKFYMEVNELPLSKAPPFVNNTINALVKKAGNIFEGLKSPRQSNIPEKSRRALAVTVVDQLFQYDLLSQDQIINLFRNKKLFSQSHDSSFITEVQLNLRLSSPVQEQKLRQAFASGRIKSEKKPAVIRSLSRKYFQEPSKNLNSLQELADNLDLNDQSEVQTFFNVMYSRFNRYTQEQKEDFIVEYSQKSNKNLEELFLWYADTNFSKERQEAVCKKLNLRQVDSSNLSYVCSS